MSLVDAANRVDVRPIPADRTWPRLRGAAAPWDPPAVPTIVISPHPDDESLMAGALIARQRAREVPVTILAVTDGEASHPGSPGLAARRRDEQHAALRHLGVAPHEVVRLGQPDGHVDPDEVARGLRPLLPAGDHLVVAPWPREPHADHEACGRAALSVTDANPHTTLVFGIFWSWHWVDETEMVAARPRRLDATLDELARRHAAILEHRSHTGADGGDPMIGTAARRPLDLPAEYHLARP